MPTIQFHTVFKVIAILVFISGLLFFSPAVRAEPFDPDLGASWRCGNLVMEKGLTKRQVLDACGKPVHMEKSYLEDYGEVEKLVYGPDAGYIYRLIFFDDRLVNIKSQPY